MSFKHDSGHIWRVQRMAAQLVTSPKFIGPDSFEQARLALLDFAIKDHAVVLINRNVRRFLAQSQFRKMQKRTKDLEF